MKGIMEIEVKMIPIMMFMIRGKIERKGRKGRRVLLVQDKCVVQKVTQKRKNSFDFGLKRKNEASPKK